MSRPTPRWAIEHPESVIDHDGSGDYADAQAVVAKFQSGKIPFHHALRRMEDDFGMSQKAAFSDLGGSDGFPSMKPNTDEEE